MGYQENFRCDHVRPHRDHVSLITNQNGICHIALIVWAFLSLPRLRFFQICKAITDHISRSCKKSKYLSCELVGKTIYF